MSQTKTKKRVLVLTTPSPTKTKRGKIMNHVNALKDAGAVVTTTVDMAELDLYNINKLLSRVTEIHVDFYNNKSNMAFLIGAAKAKKIPVMSPPVFVDEAYEDMYDAMGIKVKAPKPLFKKMNTDVVRDEDDRI